MSDVQFPESRDRLNSQRANFVAWLQARGAQVLDSTNEYEELRFRAGRDTIVLYAKANGRLTWGKAVRRVWRAFKSGEAPDFTPAGRSRRPTSTKRLNLINTVIGRDGNHCFFCGQTLSPDDTTLEHLVPLSAGGPNHVSNLVAAHQKCNLEAGHMSAMEKVMLRETKIYGASA